MECLWYNKMSNGYRRTQSSPQDIVHAMIESRFSLLWTALPGIIQSFDPEQMTVEVQPALTFQLLGSDQSVNEVQMPILGDVPIIYPGGGGYQITIPIHEGDECLLVINNRCIDSWWQSGGVQPQAEFRVNDLSDAMAFVGVRSLPRVMTETSNGERPYQTDRFEIRKDDGKTWISLTDDNHVDIEAEDITAHFRGNSTVAIDGSLTAVIEKDSSVQIKGNSTKQVTNNEDETIGGNWGKVVTGNVNIETQAIVTIGDGTVQQTPLGQALMLWLNTHQHVTGAPGAPTSPAMVPATPAQFSQKVKTFS